MFAWAEHARTKLAELPKEQHFANQILFSAGFASQHNGSFSRACAVVSISCSGPALPRLGEIDLMGLTPWLKVISILDFIMIFVFFFMKEMGKKYKNWLFIEM